MEKQTLPPKPGALPFHLMLGLGGWMSSTIAFECFRQGLSGLNQAQAHPEKRARKVKKAATLPNGKDLQKLGEALQKEALARAESFLGGLQSYFATPYARELSPPPAVWQKGQARLLDYSALADALPAHAPVVFFIPSLINRYYILDLEKQRSLARFLTDAGCHVLMLDWQSPGAQEAGYSCADYVTQVLAPCLDFIGDTTGKKPILAGYCMGGVLALALAQLKPGRVSALALLATPWDFKSQDSKQADLSEPYLLQLDACLEQQSQVPAEWIQTLFYLNAPWLFQAKFQRFSRLSPQSPERREFMALEGWVNDGVPMTSAAARECMIGWAQHNLLARGRWRVGGRHIRPVSIRCPVFIALPKNDTIVPTGSAMALAAALPHADCVTPSSGHVSMIVGKRARQELWVPLQDWIMLQRNNN